MTSLTDILLGTPPSVNTSSMSNLTPQQQQYLNQLLGSMSSEVGNSTPTSFTTQPSQDWQTIMNDLISGNGMQSQNTNISFRPGVSLPIDQSANQFGIDQAMKMMSGEGFNNYFDQSVQNPTIQAFKQQVLPAISNQFAGKFYSSDTQNAVRNATHNLTSDLTASRAKAAQDYKTQGMNALASQIGLQQGYLDKMLQESGLNNQQNAVDINAFNSINNAINGNNANTLDALTAALTGQTQQQQIQQSGLNNQIDYRKALLQLLLGGSTTSTMDNLATVNPGSSGVLGNVIQAGGTIAAAS